MSPETTVSLRKKGTMFIIQIRN